MAGEDSDRGAGAFVVNSPAYVRFPDPCALGPLAAMGAERTSAPQPSAAACHPSRPSIVCAEHGVASTDVCRVP